MQTYASLLPFSQLYYTSSASILAACLVLTFCQSKPTPPSSTLSSITGRNYNVFLPSSFLLSTKKVPFRSFSFYLSLAVPQAHSPASSTLSLHTHQLSSAVSREFHRLSVLSLDFFCSFRSGRSTKKKVCGGTCHRAIRHKRDNVEITCTDILRLSFLSIHRFSSWKAVASRSHTSYLRRRVFEREAFF